MKFTLQSVAQFSEQDAYDLFRKTRWAETGGEPVCPRCGGLKSYRIGNRKVARCAACRRDYTVTSGTYLNKHKLPLKTMAFMVAVFVNSAKGVPGLQMQRDTGLQYKSVFVLLHKFREAIQAEQAPLKLSGVVEIDGAFFGGHFKRTNVVGFGRKTRLILNKRKHRRVVVVARQRGGRTLTSVGRKESDAIPFILERVEPGATIHVDMAHAWDSLAAIFETMRISHKHAYSFEGACTNWAESFNARLRRIANTHHKISGDYLAAYAAETAWREDHRHLDPRAKFIALLSLLLRPVPQSRWAGYWQRQPEHKDVDYGFPRAA